MYTVFVTGGIGSGKSKVCEMLVSKGARLYSLDDVSHELLARQEVQRELARVFGNEVLTPQGINTKELARRAFSDAESTQKLNGIMHPRIRERLQEIIVHESAQAGPGRQHVLVIEVPLIESAGTQNDLAQEIITVNCPLEIRRVRAQARGMQAHDFDARAAAQITDSEREQYAHTVFDNSQSEDYLQQQVDSWWEQSLHKWGACHDANK